MITGVSGVGKSGIATTLTTQFHWSNISFSDLMRDTSNIERDQLQNLPWAQRGHIYVPAMARLARLLDEKENQEALLILANHLTLVEGSEFRVVPDWMYGGYRMAGLVVIEADPTEIARRIEADTERPGRHRLSEEFIEMQQHANRVEAHRIARKFRLPLIMLDNAHFPRFREHPEESPAFVRLTDWINNVLLTQLDPDLIWWCLVYGNAINTIQPQLSPSQLSQLRCLHRRRLRILARVRRATTPQPNLCSCLRLLRTDPIRVRR